MEWLEQNLDAYRIVGEILNNLRRSLQNGLREIHGAEWFRVGIPTAVFDRLVTTKEGETAIGWYEPEYQEIMDYAVFDDLHAILEHNRDHFPALVGIVQNPSLLNARFLELEALRRKIGRARPVSDAELTFLTRFLQRFRESMNDHDARAPVVPVPEPATPPRRKPETKPDDPTAGPSNTSRVVISPPPPLRPADEPDAVKSAPQRPAEQAPDQYAGTDTTAESADFVPPAPVDHQPATLEGAIETKDTKTILRELFREVTAVAESLWSSDVIPQPVVWNAVRTSNWYEKSYAPLGLKPLSDFFSVIEDVERRMAKGLAKHELQSLLEESNFAQVLLALRDMFQRNKI